MNHFYRFYLLLLIVFCTTSSCLQPISLDSGEDLIITVNCILKESDIQTIETSCSDVISASIIDNNLDSIYEFKGENGIYTSDFYPEYGHEYTLTIISAKHDTITGHTSFPEDLVVAGYMKRRDVETPFISLTKSLLVGYELRIPNHKPGIIDPYGQPYNKACNLWIFPSPLLNISNDERLIGSSIQCVDDFNLTPIKLKNLPIFSVDSLKQMSAAEKEQIRWIPSLYGEIPMHQGCLRVNIPNMYNNHYSPEEIDNGAIYSERSFIIYHDFMDRALPAQGGLFDIYNVSDEYDLYLRDIYQRHFNEGKQIMLLYNNDDSYSNISGGKGIFGAYTTRHDIKAIRGYKDDF